MRLKRFDLDGEGARINATVVSVEGIWHLYNMIAVGDTIRTSTMRKVVRENTSGSGTSSQRRMLTMTLLVTAEPEYDPKGIIRVSGRNQTQCDDVPLQAHHTIEISYDPPQDFKLFKKEWDGLLEKRLKEACTDEARSDVAAILLQNGLAQVVFINGTMMTTRAKVETSIPKKQSGSSAGRDNTIMKFMGQTMDMVLQNIPADKMKVILFASPGHVREEFLNYLRAQNQSADAPPALKAFMQEEKKFCLVRVSSGHRSALTEALRDPNVQKRMESARVANDVLCFEAFQKMMAKDPDRAVYGLEAVFYAIQDHQVDTLLLSDELLRAGMPRARHLYTELASETEEYGGTTQVFSSIGSAAEELRALTGIAAILRVPMPQLDEIEPSEDFVNSDVVSEFLTSRHDEAMAATETYRTGSSGGTGAAARSS